MNKYFIFDKIYKLTCNKYMFQAVARYYVGKYTINTIFLIHNLYNILC